MPNPKLEALNSKQTQMSKAPNSKPYHLEDELFQLSKKIPFEFCFLDLFRI
jgi:hypothetical protein